MRRLLSLIFILPALFACGKTTDDIYAETCSGSKSGNSLCKLVATDITDRGSSYLITLNRPLFNGNHHDSHSNMYYTNEHFVVRIIQPNKNINIEIGSDKLGQSVMENKQNSTDGKGQLIVTMPWDRLTSLESGVDTFMEVELTDWGNVTTTARFSITFP